VDAPYWTMARIELQTLATVHVTLYCT